MCDKCCEQDHCCNDGEQETKILKRRIIVSLVLFAVVFIIDKAQVLQSFMAEVPANWVLFAAYLVPYFIAGFDVLARATKNIARGKVFDENFLMCIATIGAFAMILFPEAEPSMAEGCAVMIFYQIGELFEDYAVGKSRKSISDMLDIAPDYANVESSGSIKLVPAESVSKGSTIVVKPGERVPLDGIVLKGTSQLDTSALTGESCPKSVKGGDAVISGCVNLNEVLYVKTTKPLSESTVSRILQLVENASEKKARTESFISRFARYYTPIVTISAACIAVIPSLLGFGTFSDWLFRGLTFLVVSCPCALVISVPLSFFCGIGAASNIGVLVKGSNYLEALSKVDTVVFDKTGTLTSGKFAVTKVCPFGENVSKAKLLKLAAHAESMSNHPIAKSIVSAYSGEIEQECITGASEKAGKGVEVCVDGMQVLVGNAAHMSAHNIEFETCNTYETAIYVAINNQYAGYILVADTVKPDAASAISALKECGVAKTVMLTGDKLEVAKHIAEKLKINEFRAELLPQNKVSEVEKLLANAGKNSKLAFVGDGINDAPSLMRADVGIAMGAMGSDAAIEAADVVLMDDSPAKIAVAKRLAVRTMGIVWQNIVFALGIKFAVLILAAIGFANMWLAVFADVGVCVLAILNAMRAMNVKKVL